MKRIAWILIFCFVVAVSIAAAESESGTIETIYTEFENWDQQAKDYDHQTVVGLYTAVEFLEVIAEATDKDGQYTENISQVMDTLVETDKSAETVYRRRRTVRTGWRRCWW